MDELSLSDYLRFLMALIFVVGLVFLVAVLAKKYGLTRTMGAFTAGGPKGRRLALVEMLPIDGKRRLVLVKRDQTEHLVLLSQEGDTVIERGISLEGPTGHVPAITPPEASSS